MTDLSREAAIPSWRPWLVWGLGGLLFAYGFFQRFAPSVMIDPLMRDLALDGAQIGNLSALYFYAYAAMQIPVGLMLGRFGPRRLLVAGALLCGLGTLGFALAESAAMAYAGRFLVGFGASFSFVSALALAVGWFPASRFGQLTGLTMMSGCAGGFLAQGPLAVAVEAVGWRDTLLATAALALLLALALWTLVRDRAPGVPPPAEGARRSGLLRTLGRVVTRRQNLQLALICGSLSAPMLSFGGLWGVAWLMQTQGLSRPEAGAITSTLVLGWAVGSPLAGWLSDRLGRRLPVLRGGMLVAGVALLPLLLLPNPSVGVLVAGFFVCGLGGGCAAPAFALIRAYNPAADTSAALGMLNGALVAAGALFQPLIGFLLDRQWDGTLMAGARAYSAEAFRLALLTLPCFLAVTLLSSLLLREPRPATRAA